ncbi:MAG: hypothetical protein ABTQ25_10500 [Nitrosomonas ureae]
MNTIEEKQIDELAAYKGKWRNRYFAKDGSSFLVNATKQNFWDSEKEASQIAVERIAEWKAYDAECRSRGSRGILNLHSTEGKKVYCDEVVYAIAFPVGEK